MDYVTDFTEELASTQFGSLHYLHHQGSGKKLIFLHGLGGTAKAWAKFMQYLPNVYDVYLVDLLGHGKSDAPHINYTIRNQTTTIRDFVEGLRLDDIYIIGNSYGGWIGAYYASLNPVKGLVLEDAAGLKESFDQIRMAHKEEYYKESLYKNVMLNESNKDYVIKSILESDLKEEELDDKILGRIDSPTLIVWGARDAILSSQMAPMFQSKIKGSEMHIIEDAGHIAHYTNPEQFLNVLTEFLNKN